jgi:hypothetical protein
VPFLKNLVPKVLTFGTKKSKIKTKKTGGNKDDGAERNDYPGARKTHSGSWQGVGGEKAF